MSRNSYFDRNLELFHVPSFPTTRYQGSKLKLVDWIWNNIRGIEFESALDAFGGTGSVGYMFKTKGKRVTYNDRLKFNYYIGLALIENDNVTLSNDDIDFLLQPRPDIQYPTFIRDTFHDIYFTDAENEWLDIVVTNIKQLSDKYKQALAYFALFQACIIKRPYNLFHRKNLYMRQRNVKRSFGNKTTWDTPFEVWFRKFAYEASMGVFANEHQNTALNCDVLSVPGEYDLVYFDPPYISEKGVGVDYLAFYHFLEGLVDYESWGDKIDYRTKHRKFKHTKSIWTNRDLIYTAFDRVFSKYKDSVLVVSYRVPGIPSADELIQLLAKHKSSVISIDSKDYKYALSKRGVNELLLVAQ